jgi:hypothetical protein
MDEGSIIAFGRSRKSGFSGPRWGGGNGHSAHRTCLDPTRTRLRAGWARRIRCHESSRVGVGPVIASCVCRRLVEESSDDAKPRYPRTRARRRDSSGQPRAGPGVRTRGERLLALSPGDCTGAVRRDDRVAQHRRRIPPDDRPAPECGWACSSRAVNDVDACLAPNSVIHDSADLGSGPHRIGARVCRTSARGRPARAVGS